MVKVGGAGMMVVNPFSQSYVVELQHSLTQTHTRTLAPRHLPVSPGSALLTFFPSTGYFMHTAEKKPKTLSFWIFPPVILNTKHLSLLLLLLCRWRVIFIHGGVKQRETVHKLINGGWSFLGHILERPRCTIRIVLVKTALLLAYDNKEVETCIIGFFWSQWTLFNGISVTRITLPGCE